MAKPSLREDLTAFVHSCLQGRIPFPDQDGAVPQVARRDAGGSAAGGDPSSPRAPPSPTVLRGWRQLARRALTIPASTTASRVDAQLRDAEREVAECKTYEERAAAVERLLAARACSSSLPATLRGAACPSLYACRLCPAAFRTALELQEHLWPGGGCEGPSLSSSSVFCDTRLFAEAQAKAPPAPRLPPPTAMTSALLAELRDAFLRLRGPSPNDPASRWPGLAANRAYPPPQPVEEVPLPPPAVLARTDPSKERPVLDALREEAYLLRNFFSPSDGEFVVLSRAIKAAMVRLDALIGLSKVEGESDAGTSERYRKAHRAYAAAAAVSSRRLAGFRKVFGVAGPNGWRALSPVGPGPRFATRPSDGA